MRTIPRLRPHPAYLPPVFASTFKVHALGDSNPWEHALGDSNGMQLRLQAGIEHVDHLTSERRGRRRWRAEKYFWAGSGAGLLPMGWASTVGTHWCSADAADDQESAWLIVVDKNDVNHDIVRSCQRE